MSDADRKRARHAMDAYMEDLRNRAQVLGFRLHSVAPISDELNKQVLFKVHLSGMVDKEPVIFYTVVPVSQVMFNMAGEKPTVAEEMGKRIRATALTFLVGVRAVEEDVDAAWEKLMSEAEVVEDDGGDGGDEEPPLVH